jgi:hypothetical protein
MRKQRRCSHIIFEVSSRIIYCLRSTTFLVSLVKPVLLSLEMMQDLNSLKFKYLSEF